MGGNKALIVDSHVLIAKGTQMMLSLFDEIESIDLVSTGEECLLSVKAHRPDLVIIDFNLKDMLGAKVIQEIRYIHPDTKIIIFTGIDMSDKLELLFKTIKINALISKSSSVESVKSSIRCLLDGYSLVPNDYLDMLLARTGGKEEAELKELTEEEITIMNLIVSGKTYVEISAFIHVSHRTVNNYVKKIFEKLDAGSKTQAISNFLSMNMWLKQSNGNV